jgi:hypothetical protein
MMQLGVSFCWVLRQNCEGRLLCFSHLSVCLSASSNSAATGRMFIRIALGVFLKKFVHKIKISLKSDNNNNNLIRKLTYLYHNMSLSSSYDEKYFKRFTENQTTLLCSIPIFRKSAFYEMVWKNVVQPDRPQIAIFIWRMRLACRMYGAFHNVLRDYKYL